jgi:hypothetical protein
MRQITTAGEGRAAKRRSINALDCPFVPFDRAWIEGLLAEAKKCPPTLFKRHRWDKRELVEMVGDDGALLIEHVCQVFQVWSDSPGAQLVRLKVATNSPRALSEDGEMSWDGLPQRVGKKTNRSIVAIVDFLAPLLLSIGVPWGASTNAKMTRSLDLVAVGLFGLPTTKSELQRRLRSHRFRKVARAAQLRLLAEHQGKFNGPPKPATSLGPELKRAWAALTPAQRKSIRDSVRHGLAGLRPCIPPPLDKRPIR